MSAGEHHTAPVDRIPFGQKLVYGAGAFVNNLLAAAIGSMTIVLNLGLKMDPALVGLLGALPRVTDAITDPLMGYVSDNTKTRWGRRRPFIFVGAILAGLTFILLWQMPAGMSERFYFVYFLIGSIIFYLAYTCYATPWVALGYELTPDYHERTRLMAVQNFIAQLAYVVAPWFLWVMKREEYFADLREGAAGLAVIIGVFVILVGLLPALFLRERNVAPRAAPGTPKAPRKPLGEMLAGFFKGFGQTLKFKPFLKLCAATFLVFNGFILIAAFQSYVIIFYVFGGDAEQGGEYVGWSGSVGAVSTFVIIPIVTWLSSRLGKRRAFFVATGISIVGYLLKWVCYNPELPWLCVVPAPLMSFGLGGLFTLMPSMVADVVDMDEVETYQRREGMFGSIFWWVVKLGQAAALAGGGILLNVTGFDAEIVGPQSPQTLLLLRVFDCTVPALASILAIWAIWSYSLTEDKAFEVRAQLEARRGKA